MDTVSPERRSAIMSRIKGKGTSPERRLRSALAAKLGRFSCNADWLPGKPDMVFAHKGLKVSIFVDGCFWHACPLHYKQPRSNRKFWVEKVRRNVERDRDADSQLHALGWKVIRVWECLVMLHLPSVMGTLRRELGKD